MHDKMNDKESVDNLLESLNEYFDLTSLNIDDLSKQINECNFDNENEC